MGNKLRHEGDEVRIKVICPDDYIYYDVTLRILYHYCSTRIWDIWDILNYVSTILLASCYYNIIMGLNGFKGF